MFADRDVKREYNVQHAVGGSEQMPLNLWSIVFLTKAPDHATASRSSKWSAQDCYRDLSRSTTSNGTLS